MPANMKIKKLTHSEETPQRDLLDAYSPLKLGTILPTSNKKKVNTFRSFQPKPGECVDYNISETVVKWNVGETKINLKDTKATYVPAPPESIKVEKKKRVKYSHGGPPQWEFVDEIWRKKQNELQEQNKKNFRKFLIRRNQTNLQHGTLLHNMITSMVGPIWFQELSPKQLRAVDMLSCSMFQDYKNQTIIHTKETIADLGLVLRPNSKHIELALKLCCGCAVEFLLILYQLINPKRECYSINDRLLLSAVVHLTMTETLREMHVRIPSPPSRRKAEKKPPKKVEKKEYKSPYLVPYTFQRERQKYTGVYENKHIQYPQSPYFSYLDSLHWEIHNRDNILEINLSELDNSDERDLLEDMQNAQKLYNALFENIDGSTLLKPTIKKTCQDFQLYKNKPKKEKFLLAPLAQLEDTTVKCTCLEPVDEITDNCCDHDIPMKCDCEDLCCCKEKSKLFMASLCPRCIAQKQHKNFKNIVTGITVTKSQNVIPVIGGTYIEKTCQCMTEYKLKLMGVAARNKIRCQQAKYVIGGVVHTKIGTVYLISTAIGRNDQDTGTSNDDTCTEKNSKCICDGSVGKEEESFKKKRSETDKKVPIIEEETSCECRKELDRFLQHKCACESCKTEASKQATFIVQGIKTTPETPVNIIAGVQDQKCDCLQKHLESIKKADEYKKRAIARHNLKKRTTKYMITGVTLTPDGPVYSIGGIRQPVQCVCAEVALHRKEEEERCKRMAKMPDTGRIKYEISGVRHGSQENTFIISKALPVEPCSCEKLFEQYENEHRSCLDYFDEYLRRMTAALEEGDSESSASVEEEEEESVESTDDAEVQSQEPQSDPLVETADGAEGKCSDDSVSPPAPAAVADDVNNCYYEGSEEVPECFRLESDPLVAAVDDLLAKTIEKGGGETGVELKRFVVLDKIPCDVKKQKIILKKVLAGMADDGFPLAKLPDCHRLPHFKLWMAFRCGRYWKQKDRVFYENFTKFGYKHIQVCYRGIPVPKLNLSLKTARKLTWNNAAFCRNLIKQKNETFHRAIKEARINGAREYFPLMFSYEFPTPTFRDCYFAYFPSKEEDIFVG